MPLTSSSLRETFASAFAAPEAFTADLKAMILGALDDAGGQAYLAAQAKLNPAAFMALVGKVLPLQLNHSGTAPLASELKTATARGAH
jgi:hypothetical protein